MVEEDPRVTKTPDGLVAGNEADYVLRPAPLIDQSMSGTDEEIGLFVVFSAVAGRVAADLEIGRDERVGGGVAVGRSGAGADSGITANSGEVKALEVEVLFLLLGLIEGASGWAARPVTGERTSPGTAVFERRTGQEGVGHSPILGSLSGSSSSLASCTSRRGRVLGLDLTNILPEFANLAREEGQWGWRRTARRVRGFESWGDGRSICPE